MSIRFLDLHWWEYLFIVLSIFITCLFLNYLVKRMNDVKLDERFARLSHKASTTQSTQVHRGLIEMEPNRGPNLKPQNNAEKPAPKGISLVFNQEQNKRRRDLEETFNIIKNTIDSRKLEVLSLQTIPSHETVEYSTNKRSNCNLNELLTVKEKESGQIVNKTSFLEISLKESHQSNHIMSTATKLIEKNNEDVGSRSSIVKTVDTLVSKIAGSSNLNDESPSQQKSPDIGPRSLITRTVDNLVSKIARSSNLNDESPSQQKSPDIGPRSLIMRTVDSLVSKIVGSSITNDDSLNQQKPMTDWMTEVLVPQISNQEDFMLPSKSNPKNN